MNWRRIRHQEWGTIRGVLVVAGAALVIVLALTATGRVDSAQAARCTSVHAGGKTAYRIHAHNLGCHSARRHLRRWMRTHFPHRFTGWFCDLSSNPKLCSKGNGAGAPYFTFFLRR
jgi:hypothetical protein